MVRLTGSGNFPFRVVLHCKRAARMTQAFERAACFMRYLKSILTQKLGGFTIMKVQIDAGRRFSCKLLCFALLTILRFRAWRFGAVESARAR